MGEDVPNPEAGILCPGYTAQNERDPEYQSESQHLSSGETAPERQRGRSIHQILVKGEFSAIKHSFCKRFSASHEKLMSS